MSSLTSGYQQISTISTKSKIAMPKTMQRARTKKNLQIFLIVKRSLGLCKASNFLTVSSTLIWNGFVSFLWCSMFSKYFWFWELSLSNWESKCSKKKPGKFKFDTWQLLTWAETTESMRNQKLNHAVTFMWFCIKNTRIFRILGKFCMPYLLPNHTESSHLHYLMWLSSSCLSASPCWLNTVQTAVYISSNSFS